QKLLSKERDKVELLSQQELTRQQTKQHHNNTLTLLTIQETKHQKGDVFTKDFAKLLYLRTQLRQPTQKSRLIPNLD
ncbi:hypothetical protein, partial [Salmonella enterica]|uniref:hypothetical protein n=1 Tax=Salmonella enterica TaxID=28901 RepID=UPI0020C317DB